MQGSVNIFWDLLPCHFKNGADITGYIIHYCCTSGGEAQNISSSDNQLTCGKVSDHRYRCLLPILWFIPGASYIFQVAAVNRYGVGPFSDPIITKINVQSISLIAKLIIDFYHNYVCINLILTLDETCGTRLSNYNESNEAMPFDVTSFIIDTTKNDAMNAQNSSNLMMTIFSTSDVITSSCV